MGQALMGQALIDQTLVGRALMGPLGPSWAVHLWAGPLWLSLGPSCWGYRGVGVRWLYLILICPVWLYHVPPGPTPASPVCSRTEICVAKIDTVSAALALGDAAALNFANAYGAGGGDLITATTVHTG